MKKTVLVLLMLATFLMPTALVKAEDENVLRIYNWVDYIDDGYDDEGNKVGESVLDLWKADYEERTKKTVTYEYHLFETNESMLNTLKSGKSTYDLICPSDYAIQRMMLDGMLEKFDLDAMPEYQKNVSPYFKSLFEKNGWSEYAIGYMWGTMGLLYDSAEVDSEDVKTWDAMWNNKYVNKVTTKDSVRDTYFVGAMHVYKEELMGLRTQYLNKELSQADYNSKINGIMNRVDDETLAKVEVALKEMKKNIFGLEVDSGKGDIVTGKIAMNLAWSGDAVYSMDTADAETDKHLCYTVPDEGSNVWFDGWVMPKGANKELAQDFINYMSKPEIAKKNMNKIGYTSAIAGEDVLSMIDEWYGAEGDNGVEVDLTYFFEGTVEPNEDGKVIVTVDPEYIGRQFSAQYPDFETISRCGVMEDFGDQNIAVLEMWSNFKGNDLTVISFVIIGVVVVAVAAFFIIKAKKSSVRKARKH